MKAALSGAGALIVVVSGAFGGVEFMDARYAPAAQVDDLLWSALKRDIRDLRARLRERPDADDQADLEALIDRLCKNYPDDRECRR